MIAKDKGNFDQSKHTSNVRWESEVTLIGDKGTMISSSFPSAVEANSARFKEATPTTASFFLVTSLRPYQKTPKNLT